LGVGSESAAALRAVWAADLAAVVAGGSGGLGGAGGLTRRADFALVSRRHEAWWTRSNQGRPLVLATVNGEPSRPLTRRLELLGDPEAWLAAKRADLAQTRFLGDSLPSIRVDFGPVLLGALLGGRTEVGSDTTWTHAFIDDDWSNAPDWALDVSHPWWALLCELLDRVAADAAGQYLVMTPDLGGSSDVLLNLRGSEALCMDVFEQPARIVDALASILPAWWRAWSELYRRTTAHGAGLVHWLGVWSDQPYVIPACDFNAMIGPGDFRSLCLPDIQHQARLAGRAVFHLDGPDAARHIDALLEVPELQAIQFTPGDGRPSAMRWVEMFRRIQAADRALYVICPFAEVLSIAESLEPAGLIIAVPDAPSETAMAGVLERLG